MNDTPQLLGGRYEVGDLIGRGGMAEVHLGHDTRLGRQVAIKLLRSDMARDLTFLTRFRREAQSAAGLNHANIVAVYDSGEDTTTDAGGAERPIPYIVMEYVNGKTLRELVLDKGRLTPNEAARITEGILEALAYSHRSGIIHRDIKPANVMIGADGGIKVMDFGIARAVADANATMTQTQAVIGTAQYFSPEQAQGQAVDARSDLYSTGCLLFELLTGQPPFIGDSQVAIAYQHVREQPPLPSAIQEGISPALDAVVLHSLAKDREDRYQDATSFRADLQSARLGREVSAAAQRSLAAAAGAAATQLLPDSAAAAPPPAEATQVFAPPTQPIRDAAAPTRAVPVTRSRYDNDYYDDEPPRGSAWKWVLTTIGVLLVIGLAVFAAMKLLDAQQANEVPQVAVPHVVTMEQAVAEKALTDKKLVPKVEPEVSDKPKGIVTDQNPASGVLVDEGSTVTIKVSAGPGEAVVPNLVGHTEAEAKALLEDARLTPGKSSEQDDTQEEKGKIISSSPPAGQTVEVGSTVDYVISSGKVTVPNVVGLTEAEAKAALSAPAKGLTYKVTYEFSTQPEGEVINQSPARSELVDRGTAIELTVSKGPEPPPETTPPPTTPPPTTPEPTTSDPAPTTPAPTTP